MSTEAEQLIVRLAAEAGVKVFDLEMPRSGVGTLRVFICNADGTTSGIGIEQCTRLGKKLSDSDELDSALPGNYLIEVSSPGINRKLRRAEHFAGAVGEHVKVSVDSSRKDFLDVVSRAMPKATGKLVLKGRLLNFDGQALELQAEGCAQALKVLISEVREARVDFEF